MDILERYEEIKKRFAENDGTIRKVSPLQKEIIIKSEHEINIRYSYYVIYNYRTGGGYFKQKTQETLKKIL